MKQRFQTKKEANQHALALRMEGYDVKVYKFSGRKRKYPFFVGTWWEWLAAIS